jgi:hypothetical protein
LPFAITSDSATQKISHRQAPREEEHYLPRILLGLFSVLGECVCVLNLTFFSFPFISNPTAYACCYMPSM